VTAFAGPAIITEPGQCERVWVGGVSGWVAHFEEHLVARNALDGLDEEPQEVQPSGFHVAFLLGLDRLL
jgi:hypothetical protein